ncbi:MAG: adenylate/guanylate cyclase domain-containing protein [Actinomycetota bacterium]|nr:adenylate/guanylate cyclase domain-containing protein [Actinomycetota bacterium]
MSDVRFATNDGVRIAYRIVGDGPVDLMYVPIWFSNLDMLERNPAIARGIKSMARFSRMILWDRRGAGLSDRLCGPATLEQGMSDMEAVLDDAGIETVSLFGYHEGGALSMLMAAVHPERISHLVLYSTFATTIWQPDYPWGQKPDERDLEAGWLKENWASSEAAQLIFQTDEPWLIDWGRQWMRNSTSHDALEIFYDMLAATDVRQILPTIRVPTLVLHRADDTRIPIENSRHIASKIPGAKYVEVPGFENIPFHGDWESILDEVEEFLTGERRGPEGDRVLATIMITDIVGSTKKAGELGDARWRRLLDSHDEIAGRVIAEFGGHRVKSTGDGLLATFDGPARAIKCAAALRQEIKLLGIGLRVGLHTGEVEIRGDDIGGIAVHIAARVSDIAESGEILVSESLPPLVAGSGIAFEQRGSFELTGVSGEWRLCRVVEVPL